MSMSASGSAGSVAEINVTPLIDVLLVLLIIFMVIVPVASRGIEAEAPQPSDANTAGYSREVVVQVGLAANGVATYRINETSIAKEDLGRELASIFASRAEKAMFVKGNQDLDFTQIAEVIDEGHRAGVDRIGIITPGSEGGR